MRSLYREREPSPDEISLSRESLPHDLGPDHADPSEGEEEDPKLDQGDPYLTQLMLMEKKQKDFDSFDLASPSLASLQKGKPLYGRFLRKIRKSVLKLSRHHVRLIRLLLAVPSQ